MNNLIPSYIDAVRSLVGDENVAGTVTGPVKDLRFYNNAKPPTEEAIQTKLASMISDFDAQEYARNRKAEYDALNQFELISDDAINGTTTHIDAVNAIKAKYPKG